MPLGIGNVTAVTMQNLTDITNVSSLPELFININHIVYGGILYFILLWVLWVILFLAANQRNNAILQNIMYSGAVVTIISLFLRAMEVSTNGLPLGLLTDFQMWVFPIITILVAAVLWMTRQPG